MTVYYDPEEQSWSGDEHMTFGSSHFPLNIVSDPSGKAYPFALRIKSGNAGPIIGILTGEGKNNSLAGNGPLFKKLQAELLKLGAISIVFSAQSLSEDRINGYLFLPDENKWIQLEAPLPHLIYNRTPFRKHEMEESFQKAAAFFRHKNIPFFNPSFIDKLELYKYMRNDPKLAALLPDTLLEMEKDAFSEFLKKHKTVYLKPALGSKGKGIMMLTLLENETIGLSRLDSKELFHSFSAFWEWFHQKMQNKRYIAQKAISPRLLQGSRFDFRILVHAAKSGYEITGIGIRQSQEQQLTTHVPNGGKIIPYDDIRTEKHQAFIHAAVQSIGTLLKRDIGFFGEFSIDAGLSAEGDYYIYEVNSKPMLFDEKEIEEKRISALCSLFLHLTEFA